MAGTLIYETVHGSRAYGLARPESDWDFKGVFVGPAAWYHGFVGGPEQEELGPDHVRFELRKFFRLAAKANPTLLETLFTEAEDQRVVTPAGARLLAARDAFVTARVQGSFGGYALSQLKRIRTHRRWLLSPPQAPPERTAFGLPERGSIPRDQLGAVEAMRADGRLEALDLSENFLELLDRERRYRNARREWGQYSGWLKNRNPARSALEARFGYDTKHALHLVRLLRMAREILETTRVVVRRPDRDELLAIRDGAWSYDELMEQVEALSSDVNDAARKTTLPADVEEGELDALCAEIACEVHRGG